MGPNTHPSQMVKVELRSHTTVISVLKKIKDRDQGESKHRVRLRHPPVLEVLADTGGREDVSVRKLDGPRSTTHPGRLTNGVMSNFSSS